jgi:membrane associated rhomboid family serine protease
MLIKKIIDKVPVRSSFAKLILGAILAALLVSFGIIGILKLFGFLVNPAIPSVFASIGAALYAAAVRKEERKRMQKER